MNVEHSSGVDAPGRRVKARSDVTTYVLRHALFRKASFPSSGSPEIGPRKIGAGSIMQNHPLGDSESDVGEGRDS
jgi:hypothetical protein